MFESDPMYIDGSQTKQTDKPNTSFTFKDEIRFQSHVRMTQTNAFRKSKTIEVCSSPALANIPCDNKEFINS